MKHLKKYNELNPALLPPPGDESDEEWVETQKKYYLNSVEANFKQLEETLNELTSDFWYSDDYQIEQDEFFDDVMTKERYSKIKTELINWSNRQQDKTIKYHKTTNLMRL